MGLIQANASAYMIRYQGMCTFPMTNDLFLIYLFVSRHEVHNMNTHTLQNAGWYKQTK